MRKTCRECGQIFSTQLEDLLCKNCLRHILAEKEVMDDDLLYYDCDPVRRPKLRPRPRVELDANEAFRQGLSYGEYMARKRRL